LHRPPRQGGSDVRTLAALPARPLVVRASMVGLDTARAFWSPDYRFAARREARSVTLSTAPDTRGGLHQALTEPSAELPNSVERDL